MSTSNPAARAPQNNAPFARQRRRTIMACVNCRKRKIRCITTEQPPKNPCARCAKKGLPCEYVTAEHDDDSPSQDFGSSAPPEPIPHQRPSSMQPSSGPSMPASNDFSRGFRTAPPLPYTGPPPQNRRPRYSGSLYPDLSLSGSASNEQPLPVQYYSPSQTNNNPMVNQGYNPQAAQAYMANYGPPGTQPGAYAPGHRGYIANYEQMQYYGGNTTVPEYGSPSDQGSRWGSSSFKLRISFLRQIQ
ncbi:hypothetical protein B0H12DRAFT_1275638 [Mycena haematopus]|nr:hypothetical protein B0H12DRAFT_1275638 [Mycena haematopus]